MKRTGAVSLVVTAVLGLGAGFVLDQVLTSLGRPTFTPAYTVPLVLLIVGVVVVALAIPIRRATRGTSAVPIDPFRAVRVAVLAKASSLLGAAIGGLALGLFLFLLTRPFTPSIGSWGAILATVACAAALVAAGLAAEQMCTIGKDDDDEQPGADDPGLPLHH